MTVRQLIKQLQRLEGGVLVAIEAKTVDGIYHSVDTELQLYQSDKVILTSDGFRLVEVR